METTRSGRVHGLKDVATKALKGASYLTQIPKFLCSWMLLRGNWPVWLVLYAIKERRWWPSDLQINYQFSTPTSVIQSFHSPLCQVTGAHTRHPRDRFKNKPNQPTDHHRHNLLNNHKINGDKTPSLCLLSSANALNCVQFRRKE